MRPIAKSKPSGRRLSLRRREQADFASPAPNSRLQLARAAKSKPDIPADGRVLSVTANVHPLHLSEKSPGSGGPDRVSMPDLPNVIPPKVMLARDRSVVVQTRSERETRWRLLDEQDRERVTFAKALHDNIAQGLALIAMDLDLIRAEAPSLSNESVAMLERMLEETRRLATDVHYLSQSMHPAKLRHVGIATGLRGLSREFKIRRGLQVEFRHRDLPLQVPSEISLCFYRFLQEYLEETCRVGHASPLRADLWGASDALHLAVRDSGAAAERMVLCKRELLGVRERIARLGGELRVESDEQGEASIHVRIPLREDGAPPLSELTVAPLTM